MGICLADSTGPQVIYKELSCSASMSGAVGTNVAKFCRDQARIAERNKEAKYTADSRAVSIWHEKQSAILLSGKLDRERREEEIKEELSMSQVELLKRRKERLQSLYKREGDMLNRELEKLGLAIVN